MNLPNTTQGNAASSEFNQATDDLATVEEGFRAQSGRYRQLSDLTGLGITVPSEVTVTVDVYDGPDGHGYVVNGDVVLDTVRYRRTVNVGPETYRSTVGWETVIEAEGF